MNLVLLGAPGSGKGTQAVKIAEAFKIPHISTGDIFRANIKAGTPIGKKAKEYIDRGQLVPDEVVIEIVRLRLAESDCANGFILDGFPRTVGQAEALGKFANIDTVLDIGIDLDKLEARLCGRRVCSACGASFHIDTYKDTTCDRCRGEVIQRADDTPETVRKRLTVYTEQTAPLIAYYTEKGVLVSVNGDQAIDAVTADIFKVLSK